MKPVKKSVNQNRRGVILIMSMIFILIFSVLAVSLYTLSSTNAQLSSNQHKVNVALLAAQSGLECGKYSVANIPVVSTGQNIVTLAQANTTWDNLAQQQISGQSFSEIDSNEMVTAAINFGDTNASFEVRFLRDADWYDADKKRYIIRIQSTGIDGNVTRTVEMEMAIQKDCEVMNYAIAGRGRMWITGDSTIYGDIYSSWDRPEISPFNMTSDTRVEGTINTVLAREEIENNGYQLESLDEFGNPYDANGDPIGTNYEDRYYSYGDEVQGYHEGINYDQPDDELMPGMNISDYDTDDYKNNYGLTTIASCPSEDTEIEYFPHAAGNYNLPRDGTPSNTWNRKLPRHVYENQNFTDAYLPDNRNALFRNCTFDGILYIDCYKNTSTYYNNVRFEDCTFNGTIITNVPQYFKWQHNCLYFTGTAAFNNTSGVEEATILAPHFNVNIGNTNPEQGDNNILTGAIVGGIVDVRGNAQVYGTIISMCDTTQWNSGYVTNIGATLDDGGSETTELGDIGTITVTPAEDQMLPSGITTPIIIKPLQGTYSEGT